ncbi:uncharacterized protein LOC143718432 [Siphateles boraxobius]|uniref:uncharacterized protein LOC143718432 n=1 Tax=Siphateles boraxobius TaxID=180520 RepID=UPI004063414A
MFMSNNVEMNMAREDEEQNIYVNEDADVRTETQTYETKTHQTPAASGDCVMISSYRAVTVCLVLLCVVLLTEVIVLGVHISTNYTREETHSRHTATLTNFSNLTEERDRLLTHNTNLINERDILLWKNNELVKERDTFRQVCFKEYNEWIYSHSSFYYFSTEKKSWNESRRFCTEKGADLIIINNREEQDFVKKKISCGTKVWIGLTDSDEEGTWKWVDGSTPTFRFWSSKEPNGRREENCALIHSSNWADYQCNDTFLWICEKNILM